MRTPDGAGRRPPDIRDVARRAGVSVATVSNVFNRPEIVSPATSARVEAAVRELGYVRNESARQLRQGRSRTIGLVVPDLANPFFTDVARGVEEVATAAGSLVVVGNSDDDPEREARYLTLLAEQQVQGALVVPVGVAPDPGGLLRRRGIPVVTVDSSDPSDLVCSVSVNDVAGGRMALAHLVTAGHHLVGLVGAGSSAPQAVDREAGARQALVDAGLDPGDLVALPVRTLNTEGGVAAARRWSALPARRRPTAVACVNDLLALGFIQEVLRSGGRVPDDVAVVGYDDIAFAGDATVPLTSIRQPRHHLGRRATELLLEESGGGPHVHDRVVFEPELVVRASSGPRPSTGPS